MNIVKKYSIGAFCLFALAFSACDDDDVNPTTVSPPPPVEVSIEEHFDYTQYDVDDDFLIAEIEAEDPTASWDEATSTLVISGAEADGSDYLTYTLTEVSGLGEYYSSNVEGLMFGEKTVLWCEEGSVGDEYDWCRSTVNITSLDLEENFVEGTIYCTTAYDNDDIVRMEGSFKIELD